MKLPNAENAILDDNKLFGYLLASDHRDGRHKAKFFRINGYSLELAERLRKDIITLAQQHSVDEVIEQSDGIKYVLHGEMTSPVGSILRIRTVWFIRNGENFPRFVTAYPRPWNKK